MYTGVLSSISPNVPSTPDPEFYGFYQNLMYTYYSSFNYSWYYLEDGAIFSRWMPNAE